jgi:hypothetical protein
LQLTRRRPIPAQRETFPALGPFPPGRRAPLVPTRTRAFPLDGEPEASSRSRPGPAQREANQALWPNLNGLSPPLNGRPPKIAPTETARPLSMGDLSSTGALPSWSPGPAGANSESDKSASSQLTASRRRRLGPGPVPLIGRQPKIAPTETARPSSTRGRPSTGALPNWQGPDSDTQLERELDTGLSYH